MKTQWIYEIPWDSMTDEEKSKRLEKLTRKGDEVIFFRDHGCWGECDFIAYNRDMNELYIDAGVDGLSRSISTDEFTTETLVNIINALDSILYKRRESEKGKNSTI